MSQTVYKVSRDCQDDDCDEAAERGGEEEGGGGERGASCPGHRCHHHIDVLLLLPIGIIIGKRGAPCPGFQK